MKKCFKCRVDKPASDYTKNLAKKDGLQDQCRECRVAIRRNWYLTNKEAHAKKTQENTRRYRDRAREVIKEHLMAHPCVDCGITDLRVLEFDHVRGDKSFNLSDVMSGKGSLNIEKIKAEIAKCDIRCCNCHAIVTHERSGSWRTVS